MNTGNRQRAALGATALVVVAVSGDALLSLLHNGGTRVPVLVKLIVQWILPGLAFLWVARTGGPADGGWRGIAEALERAYPWMPGFAGLLLLVAAMVSGVAALAWAAAASAAFSAALLWARHRSRRVG